jgi:hypothetical protein
MIDLAQQTINQIETRYVNVKAAQKRRLNEIASTIAASTLIKFTKDSNLINQITLDDNRRIISTNRAIESSFSTLKYVETQMKSLSAFNLYEIGIAKVKYRIKAALDWYLRTIN